MIVRVLAILTLVASASALEISPPDLEGRVIRVEPDARRVVLELPGMRVGPAEVWVSVPEGATVGSGRSEKVRRASFAELRAGQDVAVWLDQRPVEQLDPLKVTAQHVLIREPAADDEAAGKVHPLDRHSMESVLDDAVQHGWLDEADAERIRDTRRFHDGVMNLGSFVELADDARWLGIPGVMREMMVPSGASLAEIADACRRIRDPEQRSFLRMLDGGDDGFLYLPMRPAGETPEAGKGAWIQAQLSDGAGGAANAPFLVSTGAEASMISPATLAHLHPQITGVVMAPLAPGAAPSYFLLIEGLEIEVEVDLADGASPATATSIFLLGDMDILGNNHLAALDVTVSMGGDEGRLRLRR